MYKNYFKTAWRNLSRNKIYSVINIAGLSIGLACAMLIILYVKDEVSYDRFHVEVHNLYRVVTQGVDKNGVKGRKDPNTGYLQGPGFAQNIPEIKNKWLENYPYRISLSWWLFASAGVLVILIALMTVSFQAIKAAIANPVNSLRTE
jgi:ABC-type antimicrobial peptide transport system permease subunit